MKLSTKGRYAVMAMVDIAMSQASDKPQPITLADIATRQEISLSYLEQLFSKLRQAGLVASMRGPGGGYKLARSSDAIHIAHIITAVDEPLKATRCDMKSASGCMSHKGKCLTHDLWDELSNQIHNFLDSVTLSDVVEKRVKKSNGVDHATCQPLPVFELRKTS